MCTLSLDQLTPTIVSDEDHHRYPHGYRLINSGDSKRATAVVFMHLHRETLDIEKGRRSRDFRLGPLWSVCANVAKSIKEVE